MIKYRFYCQILKTNPRDFFSKHNLDSIYQLCENKLISLFAEGNSVLIEFSCNLFLRLSSFQERVVEHADYSRGIFDFADMLPELTSPILTFISDKGTSCYPMMEEYSKLFPNCSTFTLSVLNIHRQLWLEIEIYP